MLGEDAEPNADLWVTADESREEIVQLWHDAWTHADATLDALPLYATGEVPWWGSERNPVTLHQVAVHLIAELHRHADIVREQIDGAAGMLPTVDTCPRSTPDGGRPTSSGSRPLRAPQPRSGPDHAEVLTPGTWPGTCGVLPGARKVERVPRPVGLD